MSHIAFARITTFRVSIFGSSIFAGSIIAGTCLLWIGCADPNNQPDADAQTSGQAHSVDNALDRGIQAHGGLDTWQSFLSLEFDLVQGEKREHHIVDLQNRDVLIRGSSYSIGYHNGDAWVLSPTEEYAGSPRFYSSLFFYFFGIPFVLDDPGVHAEVLPSATTAGGEVDRIKVSYDPGIGESPDDFYVANFNAESGLLEYVMYTVTYRSNAPSDNFNAQRYVEWQEVDGLLVPKQIDGYQWDEETNDFGDKRGETYFENVVFSKTRPDSAMFEMPEGGVIDSKPAAKVE